MLCFLNAHFALCVCVCVSNKHPGLSQPLIVCITVIDMGKKEEWPCSFRQFGQNRSKKNTLWDLIIAHNFMIGACLDDLATFSITLVGSLCWSLCGGALVCVIHCYCFYSISSLFSPLELLHSIIAASPCSQFTNSSRIYTAGYFPKTMHCCGIETAHWILKLQLWLSNCLWRSAIRTI